MNETGIRKGQATACPFLCALILFGQLAAAVGFQQLFELGDLAAQRLTGVGVGHPKPPGHQFHHLHLWRAGGGVLTDFLKRLVLGKGKMVGVEDQGIPADAGAAMISLGD